MGKFGYILAIDQGTTGTKALLLDASGNILGKTSQEITQIYPKPGWIEHDPLELFQSCLNVVRELLDETGVSPKQILAIGIANQRETTVIWDRVTGEPVSNAIVWQCRRSAEICEAIKSSGAEDNIRNKSGLPIDPYFSATKIRWLLDNIPSGQYRAENGELLFGTVDTWLIWKLTGHAVHATDVTNASRTMLYNIDELKWDKDLLNILNIPSVLLPEVKPSSHIFGHTVAGQFQDQEIPIAGVAGDQHASLFGQACFRPGMVKNTYGTGCFVLANTGDKRISSGPDLISTIAWGIGDQVTYALEGSVFSAGSAVQWLKDGLGIIDSTDTLERLVESVEDNGGVYFVPAFSGLGSPYWDPEARGTIVGLTRGSSAAHLARAALEATAYQTRDVINAIELGTPFDVEILRVDGGGSRSQFMMQFQADILDLPIEKSSESETTAQGAGYLAGLAIGFWKNLEDIEILWQSDSRLDPQMPVVVREELYRKWQRAVQRSTRWDNRA